VAGGYNRSSNELIRPCPKPVGKQSMSLQNEEGKSMMKGLNSCGILMSRIDAKNRTGRLAID